MPGGRSEGECPPTGGGGPLRMMSGKGSLLEEIYEKQTREEIYIVHGL